MSFLYAYKPLKDRMLCPATGALVAMGLTPNMVTAAGMLVCIFAGIVAMTGHLYAGVIIFFIGACFDALDGSVARASGKCSEFGRYFDSISDRVSELALITGAILGGVSPAALLAGAGSLLLLCTRIHNHRKGLDSNAAMFGRPERLALLLAGILSPAPLSAMLFMAGFILCVVSSIQAASSSRFIDPNRTAR